MVLCIEANHIDMEWRPMLKDLKYKMVFFDGLNNYYIDETLANKPSFDYVESIIFKEPIVNFRTHRVILEKEKAIELLGDENKKLSKEINELKKDNRILSDNLAEIIRLRSHVKKIIRYRIGSLNDITY